MKKIEKVTEQIYIKEAGRIPNRKSQNCLDCDANRKWLLQAYQTNHNPNIHKSKPIV